MAFLSRRKTIFLFFLLNAPFWILFFTWWEAFRVALILLAFGAMWSLFIARKQRRHLWTPKLRDIWWCLFLWSVAAAQGNIELFYRGVEPSYATLLVVGILALTVKGVFNGDKYTIDQS